MHFIENHQIEIDSFIGTKIQLKATLILLEEAAQLIVCDSANQLNNLVCTMNMYPEEKGKMSSTKVMEDQMIFNQDDGLISDKALTMSEKICQRTGLKQLLFSLNVDQNVVELMNNDMKLGLILEKKLVELIKNAQTSP